MDEINWTLYNTRLNIDGSTYRDRNINRLKQSILDKAPDSISYKTVKINNTDANLIIIDTDKINSKEIKSLPDENFSTGDYVDYASGKWLVTIADFDDEIYTVGEMSQCSLLLKWQNAAGTVIERWAVVEKPTNTSLNDGTVITTSDKQYSIKLPIDSETQNLFVNKRFLLEKANGTPLSYSLTSYDGISGNYGQGGILNITLTQDEYNSTTDNATLMIADYFTPPTPPTGQAQISGSSTMYVGGSWRYYTATFLDEDGEIIPDVIPVWTWVSLDEQTDKFTPESLSDGRFRIKASLTATIGTKVKIKLDDTDELYHAEQIVEVIDL